MRDTFWEGVGRSNLFLKRGSASKKGRGTPLLFLDQCSFQTYASPISFAICFFSNIIILFAVLIRYSHSVSSWINVSTVNGRPSGVTTAGLTGVGILFLVPGKGGVSQFKFYFWNRQQKRRRPLLFSPVYIPSPFCFVCFCFSTAHSRCGCASCPPQCLKSGSPRPPAQSGGSW